MFSVIYNCKNKNNVAYSPSLISKYTDEPMAQPVLCIPKQSEIIGGFVGRLESEIFFYLPSIYRMHIFLLLEKKNEMK